MHLNVGMSYVFDDTDLFYKLLNLELVMDLPFIQVYQKAFEPFSSNGVFSLQIVIFRVKNLYLLDRYQKVFYL